MKGWSLLRIGLTGLRRDLKIARIEELYLSLFRKTPMISIR
jgi:hypothetical protein